MNATDQRISQILLQSGLIDELQLRSINARLQQLGGRPHDIAVDLRFVDEARVAGALAAGLNMPRLKLDELPLEDAALKRLPAGFCEEHLVFPCALRDGNKTLWIAMHDPLDIDLLDQVRARANVARVHPGVAGRQEIIQAIKFHYYGIQADRSQGGGISLGEELGGGEEFKVTDISGRTMVKHIAGAERLRDDYQAPVAANAAFGPAGHVPLPTPVPTGVFAAYQDVPPPVDSGVFASTPAASAAELEAVRLLQASVERTNKVLRIIIELCIHKGFFSVDEYRARVNK